MNRIGIGYDLHRLVENKLLFLGGVEIDYHLGLEGHSDADVLLHALSDALLGAAGLGDIGFHFPPEADRYRDISSLVLLKEVKNKLDRERWIVSNTDSIIIAQAPVLAPYIKAMGENIASALDISRCAVSVKATTTERLGVCGREEGIAAQAVVLLERVTTPGPDAHEAF